MKTYCERFTDCEQCPMGRYIVLPGDYEGKPVCLFDEEGVKAYQAYIDDMEKWLDERDKRERNMIKYFLEDNDEDVWTLRDKETREVVSTVYGNSLPGYDENWQDALERYFEENYSITPDEWEIG